MHHQKLLGIILPTAIVAAVLFQSLQAQEKAKIAPAIVFDIGVESLKNNPMFAPIASQPGPANQFMKAKRLYGTMTLPDNVMKLVGAQPGAPIPLEMLLLCEFASKQERSTFLSDEIAENMESTTLNGKEYRVDPTVPNLRLLLEETRIEVGTEEFLQVPRASILGNTLKQAIGELGKAPAKIALDLDSHREFFKSAVAMIKQQGAPPPVAPFLDLPRRIDLLQLALDPQGTELLKLISTSKNPEDAAFVAKSLNALLGMAKLSLGSAPQNQAGTEFSAALIAGTQVTSNGNRTTLIIARPSNFDALMAKSMNEAREAAVKMQKTNNVRQALLAMHNYESAYRTLPYLHTADGRLSSDLSWRVRVLPFVEHSELYEQFKLDEPWDSEHNKPLAENCPACFGQNGKSTICWVSSEVESFADITDGLSNTICFMENPAEVGWTAPDNFSMDAAKKLVKGLPDGQSVIIGMYDGSARMIDNTIKEETLSALLTPSGGEVIDEF